MKLASFDIFDTVLLRTCGKPDNVFYLLAKVLYPTDYCMQKAFLMWRQQAENLARVRHQNKEVNIQAIYDDVVDYGFGEYSSRAFVEKEIATESSVLQPNIAILHKIKDYREKGYNIVFVSDMYLPSSVLKEILLQKGCAEKDDVVFVSCDHQATKVTGRLYDGVRKSLNPDEWIHYGDNAFSDVKVAKRKGIKAFLVDTAFTDIERQFCGFSDCDKYRELRILTGLSRFYRLQGEKSAYSELAADFVAPTFIPYIIRVFRWSEQSNLHRLYFLSRDSYVLMKGAEQLPHEGLDIRYLFVSRKSLLLPYLADFSEEAYMRVAEHHTIVGKPVIDLLYALDTTKEQLNQYGIQLGFDKIASHKEERQFLDALFHSDFTSVLRQRAREKEQLLVDYFRQEGLFDEGHCGMVDVGWLGSTRLMVNSILGRHGGKEVMTFYYGIRGDVFPISCGRYISYFSNEELSTATTGLIENYFSAAPYPTTVGYRREQDKVVPTLKGDGGFQETEVVKANVTAVTQMIRDVWQLGITDDHVLYLWAKRTIDAISNLNVKVDLLPFVENQDFDGERFCAKLSLPETVSLVCFGKHTTTFDKASLCYTYGWHLGSLLWRIHTKTGQIRRRLYLATQKRLQTR